jgi:hypothetical protein
MRNVRKRRNLSVPLFALLLSLPTAQALAADACTHGRSTSGVITIKEYDYISGVWQYVGSSLTHVHTADYWEMNILTNSTFHEVRHPYCSK